MFLILHFRRLSSSTATPQLHCGACHVNVKPKFTEERKFFENSHASRASWKNVQRLTNTSKSTLLRTRKDEVRSVTSTEHHRRDHSFLATCLRLEELTINSAIFCLFILITLLKAKHEKGSERCWFCGVVGRAPWQP